MKEKHRRIWLCIMGRADLRNAPFELRTEGWAKILIWAYWDSRPNFWFIGNTGDRGILNHIALNQKIPTREVQNYSQTKPVVYAVIQKNRGSCKKRWFVKAFDFILPSWIFRLDQRTQICVASSSNYTF